MWTIAVGAILLVMVLPLLSVLLLALNADDNIWPHLVRNVLPYVLVDTLLLMAGVSLATLVVGTATAWIVTMYRFPGRDMIDWLLVIPLAMPTYIIAFCYVELLDYAGPLQTWLRELFGWRTAGDYWFPSIRSLGGAILVMSAVLYPYVYLSARASFIQQSVCTLEVARTLGRTPTGAFLDVALPMARPALIAGTALALMECINDIGAVQYLGVRTLTASIFATWQERSSLGGAAQIASVMLVFVAILFMAERIARGEQRYHHTTGRYRSIPFSRLSGLRAAAALAFCFLPFLLGFLVPVSRLVLNAVSYASQAIDGGFIEAASNSMLLSVVAAGVAVVSGLVLAYARRVAANGFTRPAVGLASLGYAVPGTVLALGLLIPLAHFDNWLDSLARWAFGYRTGLILSGSLFVLVVAYAIRFQAVAVGAMESGLARISPNLDAVARTLGESAFSTLYRVHLPLLLPALGSAALLVFVDSMKELPATLLLRPFNFETLATQVYTYASLEQFETASIPALAIVLVGLVPVFLLHRTVARGRAGQRGAT
ncbi:MAG: iron ABC transporter permease [Hyphomicrobiaceae bacterium]